ncbi:MAG: hypothetical protein KDD82_09440 [Planctomycetes bacterium]|nr:hypothetical protein [Planctomycetota bacterium]
MREVGEGASDPVEGLTAEALRARLGVETPSDSHLAALLSDLGLVGRERIARAQKVAARLSTARWLGDVLVELGNCDGPTLTRVLEQACLPLPLGEWLRGQGLLAPEQLVRAYTTLGDGARQVRALSGWLGAEGLLSGEALFAAEAKRRKLPLLEGARQARLLAEHAPPDDADAAWLPLRGARGPVLAICDLRELERLDEHARRLGEQPRLVLATESWIAARREELRATPELRSRRASAQQESERLLRGAIAAGASELILDADRSATRVWLRLGPTLERRADLCHGFTSAFLEWIQGPAAHALGLELAVSSAPSVHGPCVRVGLPPATLASSLEDLGMLSASREPFEEGALRSPGGLVVFACPRGGDAADVLHVALRDASAWHPRAYSAARGAAPPGVVELPPTRAALEAAAALQPDVLALSLDTPALVRAAVGALSGGIKVFATVQAGGSLEALAGLRALGVDPLTLATHLQAVVNLRLVPKLCSSCRELDTEAAGGASVDLRRLQVPVEYFLDRAVYRARGCDACSGFGYAGRLGLFEVVLASDGLRTALLDDPPLHALWAAVHEARQLPTLLEDGLERVARGETSVAALARALPHPAPWHRARERLYESTAIAAAPAPPPEDDTCWTRQWAGAAARPLRETSPAASGRDGAPPPAAPPRPASRPGPAPPPEAEKTSLLPAETGRS